MLPRASRACKGVPNECTPANLMSALVPKVTRELTRMRRTLRETFGLDKLRPGQAEVMRSVLEGNNTLAIMPTGAGKSLCYQLPCLHLPGTTVIVSPLISLMKDQVDKLEKAGLEAAQLNSALTTQEHEENLEQLKTGAKRFYFCYAGALHRSGFPRGFAKANHQLCRDRRSTLQHREVPALATVQEQANTVSAGKVRVVLSGSPKRGCLFPGTIGRAHV